MSAQPSLKELRWKMREVIEALNEAIKMEGRGATLADLQDFLLSEYGAEAVQGFKRGMGEMSKTDGR